MSYLVVIIIPISKTEHIYKYLINISCLVTGTQ